MAKRKALSELHKDFLKQEKYIGGRSPQTLRGYFASFQLLGKILHQVELKDLTPEVMEKFFSTLQKRERLVGRENKCTGIKNSTIGSYRNRLNQFFKWLIARGLLKKNPFDGVGYPPITYGDRKFLSKRKLEAILASIVSQSNQNQLKSRRDLAMCKTLLFTGVRKGELLGIRLQDINLDRRELFVRWQTSKLKTDRVVPLNGELVATLKDYLDYRRKSSVGYKNPYLFVSMNKDSQLTEHGLKHWVEEIRTRSGIKFHLHQFRHTYAVNLIQQGCNLAKVKELLGHNSVEMTVKYLRCLPTTMMRMDVENLSLDRMVDYPDYE